MINGNAVGGITGYGKTFILVDENGNEVVGTVVDELTVFDADPSVDIREGKTAVIDSGVVTGSAVIPNYFTYTGNKVVTNNSNFVLPIQDGWDYTKLQAMICNFNTDVANSVYVDKVVIENKVFDTKSTNALSVVSKDSDTHSINFGIVNTSGNACIIRYFMYKEMY